MLKLIVPIGLSDRQCDIKTKLHYLIEIKHFTLLKKLAKEFNKTIKMVLRPNILKYKGKAQKVDPAKLDSINKRMQSA